MSTADASITSAAPVSDKLRIFLIRGLIAIVWAVVFVAVVGSATNVSTGAGVLLVLYPLIDVVGSALDARGQVGSARTLLLADAGVSTAAAVALGVAATGSAKSVLAVFGVWALIAGAAQLVVALRRRAQLGIQWPMLLAGGVSVLVGIVFIAMSAAADAPKPMVIAIYAATGGADFLLQAWLLGRRRHRAA